MQKRKGFTLVELVIVIAVIAILAGVLIGTFASVINKANESAKMQEMKAAEHDKKANDILEKLNNAQWFGWEDLETKIGEAVQQAVTANLSSKSQGFITAADLDATKVAIINAVDQAVAKYAASAGQGNSNLTAEEVKYIVEQAVSKSGGVTEAQVKAIVNQAVTSVTGTQLTASQVQRITDAAVKKVTESGLTAADVAKVVSTVVADLAKEASVKAIETKMDGAITTINNIKASASTLTADEIADIVSKYVNAKTGEVKGDFTWFTGETEMEMPASEAALQALSVLSQTGETFKGQTITITKLLNDNGTAGNIKADTKKVIELKDKWIPIQNFEGTLDGAGYEITGIDVEVVYWATNDKGSTGVTYTTGRTSSGWYGERKAFGFIGRLEGTVKDLTLNYSTTFEDTKCAYGYFGGVAGVVQGTTTIQNVEVKGTITGYYSIGGLVGTVYNYCSSETYNSTLGGNKSNYDGEVALTLKDNKVSSLSIKSKSDSATEAHSAEGALIGEFKKFWIGTVTISENEIKDGAYLFQSNGMVDNGLSNVFDKTTAPQASERYVKFKSGISSVVLGKTVSTPDTCTIVE